MNREKLQAIRSDAATRSANGQPIDKQFIALVDALIDEIQGTGEPFQRPKADTIPPADPFPPSFVSPFGTPAEKP